MLDHPDRAHRLMAVQIIGQSNHPDVVSVLARAAHDADPDVQRTAVDALAGVNTPDAASALRGLRGSLPDEWLARALAAITQPAALEYLREIEPECTTLSGVVLEDDGKPFPGAHVQVVHKHFFDESAGWGWMPVSARAETDPSGAFALAVLSDASRQPPQLKVTTPPAGKKRESVSVLIAITLLSGQHNQVRVRVDRFFSRLVIDFKRREWQEQGRDE
jgi:hypothetical protein